MLALALLTMVDLALLAGAMRLDFHPGIVMAGHVSLTLLAVTLAMRWPATRRVAAMVGMAIGPLGVIGGVALSSIRLTALRHRATGDDATTADRTATSALLSAPALAPASGAGAMVARLLDGRVRHPDPDSLGSLITILRHGDVDARRGALEAAVRNFDPRLSPVVARALTDEDQTIRALAAAAASRIAQRLAEERADHARARLSGDAVGAGQVGAALWDHSRFDILLSDTQRDQIARDVCGDDAARQAVMTLNDRWKAHDFAAIDRICAAMAADDGQVDPAMRAAARWWTGPSC